MNDKSQLFPEDVSIKRPVRIGSDIVFKYHHVGRGADLHRTIVLVIAFDLESCTVERVYIAAIEVCIATAAAGDVDGLLRGPVLDPLVEMLMAVKHSIYAPLTKRPLHTGSVAVLTGRVGRMVEINKLEWLFAFREAVL